MKKILISSMLTVAVILSGCSNKQPKVQNTSPQSSTQSQVNTSTQSSTQSQGNTSTQSQGNTSTNQEFTLSDLKKYNGQNGNPAYVAIDGVVYDVTHARGWRNGKHAGGVTAGKDLTKEIDSSPHGKDVLSGLPVVGSLKK